MSFKVSSNAVEVVADIRTTAKQLKFALMHTINKVAYKARDDVKDEMKAVFDRPTNWVLNSIQVKPANGSNDGAIVKAKDDWGGENILMPQVDGGNRRNKGFEKALRSAGLMAADQFVVPAAGAKLDNYGNMSKGQVVQVMSQLQLQRGGGYESRASNSAASKRSRRKQGVTYFAIVKQRGKLKPGIYLRRDFAKGSAVKPVYMFVRRPSYKQRLRFHEVLEQSVQKNFKETYIKMINQYVNK